MILLILSALTNQAKSQTINVSSIIPDEMNVWGPPLEVNMMGLPFVVRVKVAKHKGFTCTYNVELTNNSNQKFTALMGFLGNTGQLEEVTAGQVVIKPGESLYWERWKNGVLKKGMKDGVQICKNCNPTLGFLNIKIK